jgi:hypothetical protein
MRTAIKIAVSTLAIAVTGMTFTPLSAFASRAPVQGVGAGLTDTQLIHFPRSHGAPWQREPDGYIGTKDQGKVADPIGPRTTRTYHIRVANTGNVTETMAAFPAAAVMSRRCVFSYRRVSPKYVDAASSWTTVTPARAVVAPGASYVATVRVTIPARARAGRYYAVVWAGPLAKPGKPGKAGKPCKRGRHVRRCEPVEPNITLAIYVGIREYLTVP